MSGLDRLTGDFIESTYGENAESVSDATRYFIEKLTFASPEEILAVLRGVLREDILGIPVWARNLAYRLACLQRPDDPDLLREAAADILFVGPDWDDQAEAMMEQAARLES
ncbi:hypothetical protein ACFXAF_37365 [Kitasatospora sp. NPDC059463]|uniref:hypothetical protein n=1 Tax=unclassified Kitasatospora TaxID=2633591 RepID=UPI0036ADAF36